MSILLHEWVEKPTYCYTGPVKFKEENHIDSRSLVQAFLDDWDYAITTFKCGDWKDFWDTCVDADAATKEENSKQFEAIYDAMWDKGNDASADVLFAKVIHYFEPALKLIPCFIHYEPESVGDYKSFISFYSIKLWSDAHFADFFRRELSISEKRYLSQLIRTNLKSSWDRKYDHGEEVLLYACQMLKEKVFSLYGYVGAEEEFLTLLSDFVETSKATDEELVKVYQGVADRLFQVKEYVYKGQVCTSLEEFGALWKEESAKWTVTEWDAFIETLYEEKKGELRFLQWLLMIGEQELYNRLKDWKMEDSQWESIRACGKEIVKLPTLAMKRQGILGLHFSRLSQLECNAKIDTYEAQVDKCLEWVKEQSERPQAEMRRDIYARIYQYLAEAIDDMPKYDSSTLKAELDAFVEEWQGWEERNLRYFEDKKLLAEVFRNHDVLSCWNYNFVYDPENDYNEKIGIRQYLTVLACAPIDESYQKDCKAFLQLINEGCAPEEVQRYVEAIFKYIYMELVKEGQYPGMDEMLEYYFRLLEKMSEKLPETMTLSDILSGGSYRKFLFSNYQIKEIEVELRKCSTYGQIDEDTLVGMQDRIKEATPIRERVGYTKRFDINEAYNNWYAQRSKIREIENEWLVHSKEMKQLFEEWAEYINENFDKKSIAELYKEGKDKVEVALEYQKTLGQKEKEWKQAVAAANEQYDIFMEARKQYDILAEERKKYEEEWSKRKADKAAEEERKKRKEEKRKWFFKK